DRSAGSASRGSRRNPGTSAAPVNPRTKCHHGAGTAIRVVADAADATARCPPAHQTAIPMMAGPMRPMSRAARAGGSGARARAAQALGGGLQRLLFLAEAEADLRAAGLGMAVEAAAGHACDADVRDEIASKRDVIRKAERRDVRHDVVRALRLVAHEPGLLE